MLHRILLIASLVLATTSVFAQDVIRTESDSTSTIDSTTTVVSPPPSAVSPSINTTQSDLCVVGSSGAVQTQILGVSGASNIRDLNCERLKIAKTLYDMGMKVAAVSVMCQDPRVFDAMLKAGTPCPVDGKIGEEAKVVWENNPTMTPGTIESAIKVQNGSNSKMVLGLGALVLLGLAAAH